MNPKGVRAFLDRQGLAPSRDLGQNFLIDESLADKLTRAAGVEAGDHVLEIGTGLGILTRALAARAARVVSLEIDAGIVRGLRAEDALPANVELIHADALVVDLRDLVTQAGAPVRVVANLPYAAASPLLRRLLDLRDVLVDWSVMVQREVGNRLVAEPGSRDYGSLGILHHLCVETRRRLDLHPQCFYPVPRVVSSFLRLTPRQDLHLAAGQLERVERLVRAAFAHRRKTIVNSLRAAGASWGVDAGALEVLLAAQGVDARARAQDLAPERWAEIVAALPAAAVRAG